MWLARTPMPMPKEALSVAAGIPLVRPGADPGRVSALLRKYSSGSWDLSSDPHPGSAPGSRSPRPLPVPLSNQNPGSALSPPLCLSRSGF